MSSSSGEPDTKPIESRLQRLAQEDAIDLGFVARVAGDVETTLDQRRHIERVADRRGRRFHSDLLFAITHHYFPYEEAQRIWNELVAHQKTLESALGRNPGIVVAAVDYLANVRGSMQAARIIPQPELEAIADLALRDDLTGLFSRATFDNRLVDEVRRQSRYDTPVALLMADLDDFKALNDRRGHPVGDEALQQVSGLIERESRDVDLACRYGGEEFAVLLPQTSIKPAEQLAERLRAAIEAEQLVGERLTVSIGVACCPAHAEDAAGLLRAADQALYEAKGSGKNRVVVASSDAARKASPKPVSDEDGS
jgi:diguanylate cyclase (GGDEF)-like protein